MVMCCFHLFFQIRWRMAVFTVIEPFAQIIHLLISPSWKVLNIVLVITTFIFLLWTVPLNTNIGTSTVCHLNISARVSSMHITEDVQNQIARIQPPPPKQFSQSSRPQPQNLLYFCFSFTAHIYSISKYYLQDIPSVWPHLLISILTNFMLITS